MDCGGTDFCLDRAVAPGDKIREGKKERAVGGGSFGMKKPRMNPNGHEFTAVCRERRDESSSFFEAPSGDERVKTSSCRLLLIILLLAGVCMAHASAIEWVRAGMNTNAAVWGIQGGLQFALHPAGFSGGDGGPRGLIRIGYPTLTNGGYDLVNFIAVEPIVKGRKGYSELEKSAIDGKNGKAFWTGRSAKPEERLEAGDLRQLEGGVEKLSVDVSVEKFENGAQVRLQLSQRSDAPDELKLTVHAVKGSLEMESCILTATMGNKARARLLFLKDGPVSSLQLYPEYQGMHFAEHRIFGVERMWRAGNGDAVAWIENDEENPGAAQPFGRPHFWDYRGRKVVQYWRKPVAEVTDSLRCAVNARFTYWGGQRPIPGGISFENFELREPFREGQSFIFGVSKLRVFTAVE
jgi:hypothetical protein